MPFRTDISEFKVGDLLRFTQPVTFRPTEPDDWGAPDVYPGEFAYILSIKLKSKTELDCEIMLIKRQKNLKACRSLILNTAKVVDSSRDLKETEGEEIYWRLWPDVRKDILEP